MYTNGTTYAAVKALIARLKEVADLYAVGYIETRAVGMCQIVQSEFEAYRKSAQDNHPNDAGQDRIGEYMARIMLSNL